MVSLGKRDYLYFPIILYLTETNISGRRENQSKPDRPCLSHYASYLSKGITRAKMLCQLKSLKLQNFSIVSDMCD